ncbi:hypothetical protein LSEI_0302 [Lacticaseibacillus paracasei ATCC 334]|uniref:Uncharacterized protein n=1 Tax=Lacticaseibacillus paracasei (strain ATCC 334 / BCRC 17002 / CCUG 31169 / CIP 107868 / KCTC 3260 / NRRL B-441) TaxID=321967 RepID=Q03CB0_LACP3|nr:hypothetical protein LSEI_0302 [Lacticaseibacillus paracasei ATCC 334]
MPLMADERDASMDGTNS